MTHRLKSIAARTRSGRDFTFRELRDAIEELAASFPVYRTYITETSSEISEQDREVIQTAPQKRRANGQGAQAEAAVFDFIERLLLMEIARGIGRRRAESRSRVRDEISATHRSGDGERIGRHSVLSIQPARLAE